MNILHVIGTLEIGGVQKYVVQLIQSPILNQFSHKILVTISSKKKFIFGDKKNKIEIDHLLFTYNPRSYIPFRIDKFCRYLFSKLYFFRMWYYLIGSNIDIVHIHTHRQIISQLFASIFSGKRIIWTIHGEYTLIKINIWIVRIINFLFHSNRCNIIADSNSALRSTLPYSTNKNYFYKIIPTGIEVEPYSRKYDQSLLLDKLNLSSDTILIGSTGRIVWQKGYDQLLSILEQYDFSKKKIHFVIAGEGYLKHQYIKQIKSLHLEEKISFIGNVNNIPEFLSELDVYIQPSLTEGFPLAVLEAMATGLPIICSNAGGLKEMIENNINGIIYEMGNLDSLYAMLIKILNMKTNDLYILGKNAKEYVMNNYTLSKSANEYSILYKLKESKYK